MAKKNNTIMTAADVQPTWEMLWETERKLQLNLRMDRVLKPVGIFVFALNLLLTTGNFIRFIGGSVIMDYFMRMPLLPAMTEYLPRSSWGVMLLFFILFNLFLPSAICAVIAVLFYMREQKEREGEQPERLFGTEIECAKALTNKAETVYVLRKKVKNRSVYPIAGVLTALIAIPILYALIDFMTGDSPAVLEISVALIALLICLFVLFWIYTGVLMLFSLLTSLFCRVPGQWPLYLIYRNADAYWESIDPAEFAKRERKRG